MDLQAISGRAIKSCVTQRNVVLRGGARAEYSMHTQASAISRGGAKHITVDSLLYGTQTERGCWSQYTPGYQAEPIITDRYIIPLVSGVTQESVATQIVTSTRKCRHLESVALYYTQSDPIAKFYDRSIENNIYTETLLLRSILIPIFITSHLLLRF